MPPIPPIPASPLELLVLLLLLLLALVLVCEGIGSAQLAAMMASGPASAAR